jgi:hypothetical protein
VLPTTPLVAASAIRLIGVYTCCVLCRVLALSHARMHVLHVGELTDWFKKHPTCLEPAIRYLLTTTASPLLRFSGTRDMYPS